MTVALVITARPSYSRVKTLIPALRAAGVTVRLVVCGSALLSRYGAVIREIERDCGPVAHTAYTVIEGEVLETTARSTALLALDLAGALRHLEPDAVIVHADRHEVLGAALAARYLELPLIQLQAGEITGSIDDRVRDAITQLADLHLVSTSAAAARVWAMRGVPAVVTGCPSIDLARAALTAPLVTMSELGGDGPLVDLEKPFVAVLNHPTSDRVEDAYDEMATVLRGAATAGLPLLVWWPGCEAGADATSKAVRVLRSGVSVPVHTVRNVPPERFLRLLTQASALVGNSSVGIRECAYLGVPAVNIGSRQHGRERAENVWDCACHEAVIADAVSRAVRAGRRPSSALYGTGDGGARMAAAIVAAGEERQWN